MSDFDALPAAGSAPMAAQFLDLSSNSDGFAASCDVPSDVLVIASTSSPADSRLFIKAGGKAA
jgi:hypothetical protein